ncbi:MAG: tetratricopeptide repeat protein, partial [Elusimicrobiota bacterium]
GYFYMNSGEPVHAKEAFESAVAADTSSALGYHHMGSYLNNRRQYAEAEKYFRRALEKLEADPGASANDLYHARIWLGNVAEAQGRHAEAEAVYLRGLKEARPGSARQLYLLHTLAMLYVSSGKSAQAEETYKRAVAECNTRFTCQHARAGGALIDLGQFYFSQGRRSEAEAMAEQAEKDCADVPIGQGRFDMLRRLSLLYASLGDVSRRDALYARLLPLRREMPFNPDLVWVESGLADGQAAEGRFQEAEDHYRQAIGMLDHNGYWKEEADMLDNLAAIDEKEGKREAAADAREQAKSLRTRQ